jgi:alkylated DNA repair dioxygenase AlkB
MATSKPEPPVPYYPSFLEPEESRDWLERSRALAWWRGAINMYGKSIPVHREECLYGDDFRYQYRGSIIKALPWPEFLRYASDRIHRLSGFMLNFVVGNRYRTGKDSIGWHANDFPQM